MNKILRAVLAGLGLGLVPNYSLGADRPRDREMLFEMQKSTDSETRIRSGIQIWNQSTSDRPKIIEMMRKDANRDVRRRIAQVIAVRDKNQEAIAVLEDVLKESDISKHKGAEEAITSAGALTEATGKAHGVDNALKILSPQAGWFADVEKSPKAFSLKDSVRIMAASFLSRQGAAVPKETFEKGLRSYCDDLERNINKSNGDERKYWEARLPTVLNIALRSGLPGLVLRYQGREDMLQEKYERERLERVIQKAKVAK